jgi:hypothetical protein
MTVVIERHMKKEDAQAAPEMTVEEALKILFGEGGGAPPPKPKSGLDRFWDNVGDLITSLEDASAGARGAARIAAEFAAGEAEIKARETGEYLMGMLNIVFVAEHEAHQIRTAVTDAVRSLNIADHLPQPGGLTREYGEGIMRAAWAKLGYSPDADDVAKAEKTTEAAAEEADEKKE